MALAWWSLGEAELNPDIHHRSKGGLLTALNLHHFQVWWGTQENPRAISSLRPELDDPWQWGREFLSCSESSGTPLPEPQGVMAGQGFRVS